MAVAADDTLAPMLVRRFIVAERSMAPCLEPGDRVIAIRRVPAPGDIVVASAPDGLRVVKRLIAVGPALVEVADERVTIDGEPSPHAPPEGTPGSGAWTVGPGQVFMLSDAPRRTDADSRSWGPIDATEILGTVRWRYRPLARWGRTT